MRYNNPDHEIPGNASNVYNIWTVLSDKVTASPLAHSLGHEAYYSEDASRSALIAYLKDLRNAIECMSQEERKKQGIAPKNNRRTLAATDTYRYK